MIVNTYKLMEQDGGTRVVGNFYKLFNIIGVLRSKKVGEKEKMLRMLREVKVLYVHPFGEKPSLDDCYDAVDIAVKNNCYVRMEWYVSHSGLYHRIIDASSNPKDVYESLPKVYGV